jgi:hypothetical protein
MLAAVLAATLILAPVLAPQPASGDVGMASGAGSLTVNSSTVGFAGQEWWVIGKNVSGSGFGVYSNPTNSLTLLVKGGNPYGNSVFSSSNVNDYSGSSLYIKMNNEIASSINNNSPKEYVLINTRTLTSSDGISGSTVANQKLWPLSTAEANAVSNATVLSYGNAWWLRSSGSGNNYIALVNLTGYVYDYGDAANNTGIAVRPALNLNLDLTSVLFSSNASGESAKPTGVGSSLTAAAAPSGAQKFTVKDTSLGSVNVTFPSQTTVAQGESLSISYSGATVGAKNYLSCVLTDGSDVVKYYGKLASLSSSGSGTVSVTIPTSVQTTASTGSTYKLKIFSEEANGDNYTDFCSDPKVKDNITVVAPKAPEKPVLTATAGKEKVDLSWMTPADGGKPIKGYKVQIGSEAWIDLGASSVSSRTYTYTKLQNNSALTPGTSYQFKVLAYNDVGDGTQSDVKSATPYTIPNAPTGLTATYGDGQVKLDWAFVEGTVPTGGSPITKYQIQKNGDGSTWKEVNNNIKTYTYTGLTNGTEYTFYVRAVNAAGNSATNASVKETPRRVPSAPAGLGVTLGSTEVTLTWNQVTGADTGGRTIIRYEVKNGSGGSWETAQSNTSHTFTGLTNGTTYTLYVRAVNDVGDGTASGGQPATPRTVPDAPTGLIATPGAAQVELTWTAPYDGGNAIAWYEVQQDSGLWVSASGIASPSHTFTGLENGTTYTFYVRAVNEAGPSLPSEGRTAIPYTVPTTPTAFTVTPGAAQATLSWDKPDFNGGRPVDYYQVQIDNETWIDVPPGNVNASGSGIYTFTRLEDDSPLENARSYTFRVRAVNEAGGGAEASMAEIPYTVPTTPSAFNAIEGRGQVDLSWDDPTFDGGRTVDYYEVKIKDSENNEGAWINVGSAEAYTYYGLTNGATYTFSVRAVNLAGEGPEDTRTASPYTVPTTPAAFTAAESDKSVELAWDKPESDGGRPITQYQVKKTGDANWTDVPTINVNASGSGIYVFDSLTNGQNYDFFVRAVNIRGAGPAAELVASPYTLATTPASIAAIEGNRRVELSWDAPADDGGRSIIAYEITKGDDVWITVPAIVTSHAFEGLTNGKVYTFKVRAVNLRGAGPEAVTTASPLTKPTAPRVFIATAGDTHIELAWDAPESDGGRPIIKYQVKKDNEAWIDITPPAMSYSFTGLTNRENYTFEVRAINVAGDGDEAVGTPDWDKDTDGDGVPDYVEEHDGTNPNDADDNKDTDGDGVPDYVEEQDGTNPNNPNDYKDTDGDGVPDYVEEKDGTDPTDKDDYNDSDGDGVPDYVKEKDGTNPNDPSDYKDSDGDGVPDYVEKNDGTNPYDKDSFKDSDGDGVPDYVEQRGGGGGDAKKPSYKGIAKSKDADKDKDSDKDAVVAAKGKGGTNPNNPRSYTDTDGDGVPDYVEQHVDGTNPDNPASYTDTDGDGVSDYTENLDGTDPQNPASYIDHRAEVAMNIIAIIVGICLFLYALIMRRTRKVYKNASLIALGAFAALCVVQFLVDAPMIVPISAVAAQIAILIIGKAPVVASVERKSAGTLRVG